MGIWLRLDAPCYCPGEKCSLCLKKLIAVILNVLLKIINSMVDKTEKI